ncbi:MAG: hypothetical protein R3C05_12645 [Pirellulaceae bacterium]
MLLKDPCSVIGLPTKLLADLPDVIDDHAVPLEQPSGGGHHSPTGRSSATRGELRKTYDHDAPKGEMGTAADIMQRPTNTPW